MSDIDIRSGLSEEEKKRLEKIDRIDSNKKRKKLIMAGVTAVLILFFVLGTVFGGMHILSYEGTLALPQEEVSYPELPSTEEEILSSLNKLIEESKNYAGVKLDVSFSASIINESITLTGENADKVMPFIEYTKDSALSVLNGFYAEEGHKGTYGEDFSAYLFDTAFNENDAEITAAAEEENKNNAKYIFTFDGCNINEINNSKTFDVFSLDVCKDVTDGLKKHFETMVTVKDADISYENFVMTANISRLENELENIEQKRICNVTLPLTFIGEWEEFGELTLSFTVELVKRFNFSRVEIFFREDVFYIEKGSSDEFKTKVISDQSPSEIKIDIVSSDPSVLSVDGSFYKGEKVSEDPVTVTAYYTYNGITYEDSCIFYVRVPVESVKVSEKEITLKTGEEHILSAVLSPDDATLTKTYWFTTDENIVFVDENGKITAKNSGEAEVYCITLDGNYKSSCLVKVEG